VIVGARGYFLGIHEAKKDLTQPPYDIKEDDGMPAIPSLLLSERFGFYEPGTFASRKSARL
jgi:hypothetical protein